MYTLIIETFIADLSLASAKYPHTFYAIYNMSVPLPLSADISLLCSALWIAEPLLDEAY